MQERESERQTYLSASNNIARHCCIYFARTCGSEDAGLSEVVNVQSTFQTYSLEYFSRSQSFLSKDSFSNLTRKFTKI